MKITYRLPEGRGAYQKTRRLIARCDEILTGYWRDGRGFALTLRQLFYKLVARGEMDNTPAEYTRLGKVMTEARYAGKIDWLMLIDRTRSLSDWSYSTSELDAIRKAGQDFMLDKWRGQESRIEVWIEKDAAIGVIDAVTTELTVPYMSTRGYHSTSGAWQAAQRIAGIISNGQSLTALHIADHDPSGVDMTRDLEDRLREFLSADIMRAYKRKYVLGDIAKMTTWTEMATASGFTIERIALNMDQIEDQRPPAQPVKPKDPRTQAYVERFGDECWELDALEPNYVAELIRAPVLDARDQADWAMREGWEQDARTKLKLASDSWNDIEDLLTPAPSW